MYHHEASTALSQLTGKRIRINRPNAFQISDLLITPIPPDHRRFLVQFDWINHSTFTRVEDAPQNLPPRAWATTWSGTMTRFTVPAADIAQLVSVSEATHDFEVTLPD
jgi:hypothetical protein